MKKKLLFVIPTFGIGGTTVSTRNLLSLLDKGRYDISVWCLEGQGLLKELYDEFPQIKTSFYVHSLSVSSWRTEKGLLRKVAVALLRLSRYVPSLYRYLIRQSIRECLRNTKFDTIIACQEGFATMLASLVPAPNRVAWVRCDYKRYFGKYGCNKEHFYKEYKHIVCVAEQTTKNFIDIYPEWRGKATCIYNPQDSSFILSQAKIDDHDTRFHTDKPIIVSLGRLSSVKRFDQIPKIARQLKERGLSFVWYIIGDGSEKKAIASGISQNNVDNCVVMLGAKSNPHFYISRANLYVCLSVSEACPRVINEAKILGTPVVSTNFPTVYEYLENGVNGRIASLENITESIAEMLTDKTLYTDIKENISKFTFDNSRLIEQVEAII